MSFRRLWPGQRLASFTFRFLSAVDSGRRYLEVEWLLVFCELDHWYFNYLIFINSINFTKVAFSNN